MGRGSAYNYQFFMLVDIHELSLNFDDLEIEFIWGELKENFVRSFKAEWEVDVYATPSMHVFAGTTRLSLGVDGSGGLPCVFVVPKTWYTPNGIEKTYVIDREVKAGFNRLIKAYPEIDLFRYPTSAWTSEVIKRYG